MKKINKLLIIVIAFIIGGSSVLAQPVKDDAQSIPEVSGSEIEDSFYFKSDDNVNLQKEIQASSLIFGNNVELNSLINGINAAFGNTVDYNGISDYAAIFGNVVNINGEIINDGAIFGNQITFSDDVIINRDIVIFGNNVILNGNFNRDVKIYASNVTFEKAVVSGDVWISADNIDVGSSTNVMGTFKHNKNATLDSENANLKIETYEVDEVKVDTGDIIINYGVIIISSILLLLILLICLPKLFDKFDKHYLTNDLIIKHLGIGLVNLILIPLIFTILILSSIGSYVGIILAIIYVLLIMLSGIVTDYTVGKLITNKLIKKDISRYLSGIIGIIVMFVLKLIPVLGGIITFISLIYGMGTILGMIFKARK